MIDQLPLDIVENILEQFEPTDIASACLVNKSWNRTISKHFPKMVPTIKDILKDLAIREQGEYGIFEDMGLDQWYSSIQLVSRYSYTWLTGILRIPRGNRITMHMSMTRAKEFFGLSPKDIEGLTPSRYCRCFYRRAFAAYDIFSLAGIALAKHGSYKNFQEWNRKRLEQNPSRKRAIDIVRAFQQYKIPLAYLEHLDCYRFIHENEGSLESIVRHKKHVSSVTRV